MITVRTIAYINNHVLLAIGNKHMRALNGGMDDLSINNYKNTYHYRASETNTDTFTECQLNRMNDNCLFWLGSDKHYNVKKIHVFFTSELSDIELSEIMIKLKTYINDRMIIFHCREKSISQLKSVLQIDIPSMKNIHFISIVDSQPKAFKYVFDNSECMKFAVNKNKSYNITIDRSTGTLIRIDLCDKSLEFIDG